MEKRRKHETSGRELWSRKESMTLMFTIWMRNTQWHRHERRVRGKKKACTKLWEKDMEWSIEDARRRHDSRQVWNLMRMLGGTGRRERKRNTKDILRDDVDVDAWLEAMSKPGGDGGCEATLVAKLGEHDFMTANQ